MSPHLAALNLNLKPWVPPQSPDHGACETITRCIASLYGFGMRVAKEIVEPGQHESRRVAVVIAADVGVPHDVITDFFGLGTRSQILQWQLELSARVGREPSFSATYQQIERLCRRCTGKTAFTDAVI